MSLLNLVLESFLLTNIWIVLYTKSVTLLNLKFPPKIIKSFLWVQSSPESFEIPLYLILTFCFTLIIIFLQRKKIINYPQSALSKLVILFTLILIFLSFIGGYPMSGEFDPYPLRSNITLNLIINFLYLIGLCLTLLIINLFKANKIILTAFIISLLLLVTFDARFPMAGHDYEYFIGPAWEVANGKTVYTDVLSRYAFLPITFLGLLQKTKIFDLFHLPLIIWLLYTLSYFSVFLLLKKVSRSALFAGLGLSSVLTLNYFSLSHLPSTIPQVGPLRWFPLILILIILSAVKNMDSIFILFSISFLSLFMIDVGVAMILAYFFSLGILVLLGQYRFLNLIKTALKFLVIFFITLLLINGFHLLLGYKFVDIFEILYSFKKHAVYGLSLIPMQTKTHFWLVILIYFASIIYLVNHPFSVINRLLLFSANLSLFASVYFVGRSHPHNLFNISLFPLLNLFIFLAVVFKKRFTLTFYLIIFLILIVYPAYQRRFTLSEMILTKINSLKPGNIFKSGVDEIISEKYKDDLNLIKNNINSKEAIVLSVDDSYLFMKIGKKNLLDANPIMGIDLPEDLDFAVKNAAKKCPQKIAVDCSYVGKCKSYMPFIGVNFDINLILTRIETVCRLKYKPIVCTEKLCIAENK